MQFGSLLSEPKGELPVWDEEWREGIFFLSTEAIRAVSQKDWALLVARGINWFPSNEDKWKGSIDVWWVVRILP